ncbi:MAG: peptidylprolyl isomerase [Burkholderiales bacterium]|nr:peptidylprolyl isomerase [Burkholderiales bacterium]
MSLSVNGIAIDPRALAEEIDQHRDRADPESAARQALVARELLRQRAIELRLLGEDGVFDESVIDALVAADVHVVPPSLDDCRAYYANHAAQFRQGDKVTLSQILFAAAPTTPLSIVRRRAEDTLQAVLADPSRFDALARQCLACGHAQHECSLGELVRGQSAPEFELVVFNGDRLGVLPRLVNTRYGFHVVRIERRVVGEVPGFDAARERVEQLLWQHNRARALRHYVALLAGTAEISGMTTSPGGGWLQ